MGNSRSFIRSVLAVVTSLAFAGTVCGETKHGEPQPVRLVVVVVVDQMRDDYLTRFSHLYTGGLSRLIDEGRVFTNAFHEHAITETAVGHATISTGCHPSKHGIVGNTWHDQALEKAVPSVADTSHSMIGGSAGKGSSPQHLSRPAVGDWLKSTIPQSKVVSIALKDRAAILMGGMRPNDVYWYDRFSGNYVTSTYYTSALNSAIQTFNTSHSIDSFRDSTWCRLLSETAYSLAHGDSCTAECDGIHVTFPHGFQPDTQRAAFYTAFYSTPFADQLTMKLAADLAVDRGLGRDSFPDLLWISCSAADAVGHLFGPNSQETQDYYLRLDRYLDTLLAAFDADVGRENYAVILTADHGVMTFPEDLSEQGKIGQRLTLDSVKRGTMMAGDSAAAELGLSHNPIVRCNYEIILNYRESRDKGINDTVVQNVVARHVGTLPFIADIFTAHELARGIDRERRFGELYERMYHETRRPDIYVNYPVHCLVDNDLHGTSHGTPYEYDRHVALVIAGGGFVRGSDSTRIRTIDVAPTIARMLNVPIPEGIDGTPIVLQPEK